MIQIDNYELENLIRNGEQEISYEIEPNIISKIQLYLSGNITKGIEVFGVGAIELRALGFMVEYGKEINYAISKDYRVLVKKEGEYFGKGRWNLEFRKSIRAT